MVVERSEKYAGQSQFPRFGERKLAVLQAYVDGMRGRGKIGAHLKLSPWTVKAYSDEAISRVRSMHEGTVSMGTVISQGIKSGKLKAPDVPRDIEISESLMRFVLGLLGAKTNKEIADDVFLATDTVGLHMSKLFKILGATNRNHAIAILTVMEMEGRFEKPEAE